MNDFDKMLYEISEEAAEQSPEITQRIQPWRNMFDFLIWGMLIFLFEINIFGGILGFVLSFIRPLIGCILIIKGLAICKSENRYFKRAYMVACGYYIFLSAVEVILAVPIHQKIQDGNLSLLIQPAVIIIIIYNLYRALNLMIEDSDSNEKINQIFWNIIYLILALYLIVFIAYYLQNNNIIVIICFFAAINVYTCITNRFNKLKAFLNECGYDIKVEKKHRRYGTTIFIICDLVIMTVLILYFINYSSSLPVTIHEINVEGEMLNLDMSEAEIDEVREQLVSMGMERYVAEDLLPEDIKKLKDVKRLLKSSIEKDFPYAGARLKITCYLGELCYNEYKVEDSDYSEGYYIDGIYVDALVYYFEWMDKPNRPYSEVLIEENMQDYNFYVDCNFDLSRWIHIADLGDEKKYYASNEKSFVQNTNVFGMQNWIIKSGTNIVKKASNYRSYIVRKYYNTGSYSNLDVVFQYVKEQKTYPYSSIYDVAMFGSLPTLEEMILSPQYDYSSSLLGVLDYSMNNMRISFVINRNEDGHSISGIEQ